MERLSKNIHCSTKSILKSVDCDLKIFLKYLVNETRTPWRNAQLPYLGQEMNKIGTEHLVIPEGEVLSQRLLASVRRTQKPTTLDSQQPQLSCVHTSKVRLRWIRSHGKCLIHEFICS